MLADYFGIQLDVAAPGGQLTALPLLLGEAWPIPQRTVPLFLHNLAAVVDYSSEETCFLGIARELAWTLFGLLPPDGIADDDDNDKSIQSPMASAAAGATTEQQASAASAVAHRRLASDPGGKLYDAIRFGLLPRVTATASHSFLPPVELAVDGSMVAVVTVEALYKVFERC